MGAKALLKIFNLKSYSVVQTPWQTNKDNNNFNI